LASDAAAAAAASGGAAIITAGQCSMLHVMADRYTAGRVRHEEAECGAAQRGAERLLSGDASVD